MQQQEEACMRCTFAHFPDLTPETLMENDDAQRFFQELEVRRLVYLRDGFSYEVRQLADLASKTHLAFECEPVDDHYKVGAFVVSVPCEEIVRVEVFAVHPSEKPEDSPQITGFRSRPEPMQPMDDPQAQEVTHPVGEE
jgi:hypothetical protein